MNSPQVARSHVAAFDGTTGAVVTSWNPGADGEVDVIKLSSLGKHRLDRRRVRAHRRRGEKRRRRAARDAGGGRDLEPRRRTAPSSRSPSPGATVYVGGRFTTVNGGATRHNFAAFDVLGSDGDGTLLSAPATTVGGDV